MPAAAPLPAANAVRPSTATPAALPDRGLETLPAGRSGLAATWLSVGLRAEIWRRGSGLGPQLGVEHELASAYLAVQVGYLVAVPVSARFSAHELPFSAQIGWRPAGLLGFRGALGVGLSVLGANPAAGISAQNDTNSTLAFVSVELSRPVALGQFALLPAFGARGFSTARAVEVDRQEVLAVPMVVVQASLSLALKVGG